MVDKLGMHILENKNKGIENIPSTVNPTRSAWITMLIQKLNSSFIIIIIFEGFPVDWLGFCTGFCLFVCLGFISCCFFWWILLVGWFLSAAYMVTQTQSPGPFFCCLWQSLVWTVYLILAEVSVIPSAISGLCTHWALTSETEIVLQDVVSVVF